MEKFPVFFMEKYHFLSCKNVIFLSWKNVISLSWKYVISLSWKNVLFSSSLNTIRVCYHARLVASFSFEFMITKTEPSIKIVHINRLFICNIMSSRAFLPLNLFRPFLSHIYSSQNYIHFDNIVLFCHAKLITIAN